MNVKLLFNFQMAAISGDDEYQIADSMKRLAGKLESHEFRYKKSKNNAIATCQMEKDGHLWLGVVAVGKRGGLMFQCWVTELSAPRLVGCYWERRKSTSLPDISGQEPTYLFEVVSALGNINSREANEELLRKALEPFQENVEKGLVSMEQMAESLDFCIDGTSVSTISGGLPSLGKGY